MPQRFTPARVGRLISLLSEVRAECLAAARELDAEIESTRPEHRASAANLAHYLGLQRHDLRELRRDLASSGLGSLDVIEPHVLASVDAILAALHRLADRPMHRAADEVPGVDFFTGPERLSLHTDQLFGPASPDRPNRIVVTMPRDAAFDEKLVPDLLRAGMTVLRINGAHDDRDVWERIVERLRRARVELGLPCRVLFDLAGPKLRTGEVARSGGVVRFSPQRDLRGDVVSPALVWLTPADLPELGQEDAAVLPLDLGFLQRVRVEDALEIVDRRGGVRRLTVRAREGRSFLGEGQRTGYVAEGSRVRLWRQGRLVAQTSVGALPMIEEPIVVRVGERVRLTRGDHPGEPARRTAGGAVVEPAHLPCTLPEVFRQVAVGQRIYIDDGKVLGEIRRVDPEEIEIEITRARGGGARLRADLGINLPDTRLELAPLTRKDLVDLDFAAAHADLVALSFVRRREDLERLERELVQRESPQVGVLLKIETRSAFEDLPRLLLAGLRLRCAGVMVARGDLGVELGFERLAEVQEEILRVAEAAHVPVVWATQVLETLAKKGRPSRAEVTDAAMSARAEAVLLNKGPHIVETVFFLDSILQRMREREERKHASLRRLTVP